MPAAQDLYAPMRWEQLLQQFRRNNFVVHSLPQESMLSMALQAGVAALKTRQCRMPGVRCKSCPVCSEGLRALAAPLPCTRNVISSLVCRVSGEIMNEDNPPMALPNGNVYGLNVRSIGWKRPLASRSTQCLTRGRRARARAQALTEMQRRMGAIVCPRTGMRFRLNQALRVYMV